MDNMLYYQNRLEYGNCPPCKDKGYLGINNLLSEFKTESDKEKARQNLGIPDIINDLNRRINDKVLEVGGIQWDIQPTDGNTDSVVSSDSLYHTFLQYVSKIELDSKIQLLWSNIINKISQIYDRVETEINLLNENINNKFDELKCNFNNHIVNLNLEFSQLKNRFEELLCHFFELKNFVRDEHVNLYKTLYCNLTKDKIDPLEQELHRLNIMFNSFLSTSSNGTALSDLFGSNEYIGINLKTLTTALNRIWNKIESITGEISNGINMIVDPTYFISENGCNVNISAYVGEDYEIFEHIAFYENGILIDEADNVKTFHTSTHIDNTTEIKCIAKIMGIEYEKTKIVTHYNSFFLLSGNFESDEDLITYAINHPEYSRPITNGLRGNYDLECNDNDKIIILINESLKDEFIRADLNGIEIPLEQETITINGERYEKFVSINSFNGGTYNIDING